MRMMMIINNIDNDIDNNSDDDDDDDEDDDDGDDDDDDDGVDCDDDDDDDDDDDMGSFEDLSNVEKSCVIVIALFVEVYIMLSEPCNASNESLRWFQDRNHGYT